MIGGAEDRTGDRVVLREFLRLAGGDGARVAVVATASALGPEVLDAYEETFRDLGAGSVVRLRPETRAQADDPAVAAALADVDAVFMTGGNQLKLTAVVAGTAFGAAVTAAYGRGAVVGGTSAGASAVSEHMIAFGEDVDSPRQGTTASAAGLGLLPRRRRRPALRTAQPVRPPALPGGPVAAPARDGRRRGHGGRRPRWP